MKAAGQRDSGTRGLGDSGTRGRAVPEGTYVDIGDGLSIHYHAVGSGPPVIFIHGSGPGASGWSNFKQNMAFFGEREFRALVPDTLGFGYSTRSTEVTYTFDLMVDGVQRFAEALGIDECALVGNSLGGAMAIAIALHRPALVRRLILMAPGGLEPRETYMSMGGIRAMIAAVYSPEGVTRESLRRVLAKQLFDPGLVTDQLVEERYQIWQDQPKNIFETMQVPNLAPRLSELACPVLALWGVNDQFCPVSGATTIAESCKRTRVVLLSECGHWVMVEHAATFNRVCVDFLNESP